MNKHIQIFPDVSYMPHNDFYIVKVRLIDSDIWHELTVYEAKVDMHDVRNTAFTNVDFDRPVEFEITFLSFYSVHDVVVRPLSKGITASFTAKKINFVMDKPENVALEINHERFHNLHIFCSELKENSEKVDYVISGDINRPKTIGDEINVLRDRGKKFSIRIKPGLYYIGEGIWHVPSNTSIYIEPGAVIKGAFVIEKAENVKIVGRGIVDLSKVERFTGTNGCRISHSKNIEVSELIFVNPPHYTCLIGQSENVHINNIRSFSCEGWSDGIDMMSCKNVTVDGGFLRTSDDCIAIYGARWNYYGDSKGILIKNISLWADVAHAMMIGTHGDAEKGGDCISDIRFENIDVLEHHEYQENYLGVMAINVGDGNVVRNVKYDNINIEHIEHGRVFDIRTMFNKDYNLIPGKGIEAVSFYNISVKSGLGEEPSRIEGYSKEAMVRNISFVNYLRDGVKVENALEANICVGEFVQGVSI